MYIMKLRVHLVRVYMYIMIIYVSNLYGYACTLSTFTYAPYTRIHAHTEHLLVHLVRVYMYIMNINVHTLNRNICIKHLRVHLVQGVYIYIILIKSSNLRVLSNKARPNNKKKMCLISPTNPKFLLTV